jgi:type IV secretory pathway VirB10-like protein
MTLGQRAMTILPTTPLLAAGIDWIEGLLPLAFVAFWIISQIINVIRSVAGGGRQEPAARGPQRPPAVPKPPRPAADPRADLERQIEEFLRGPRPTRAEPARSPTPAAPKPVAVRPKPPRPPAAPRPAPATTSRATERQVGSLDAASSVAAHVQDAFAHDLGHLPAPLASTTRAEDSSPTTPASSRADEIARLLRSPATVRQLIVLREVLERPVARW